MNHVTFHFLVKFQAGIVSRGFGCGLQVLPGVYASEYRLVTDNPAREDECR